MSIGRTHCECWIHPGVWEQKVQFTLSKTAGWQSFTANSTGLPCSQQSPFVWNTPSSPGAPISLKVMNALNYSKRLVPPARLVCNDHWPLQGCSGSLGYCSSKYQSRWFQVWNPRLMNPGPGAVYLPAQQNWYWPIRDFSFLMATLGTSARWLKQRVAGDTFPHYWFSHHSAEL